MQTIALRLSDLVLNREFCHLDMEDYFLFTSFFFFLWCVSVSKQQKALPLCPKVSIFESVEILKLNLFRMPVLPFVIYN